MKCTGYAYIDKEYGRFIMAPYISCYMGLPVVALPGKYVILLVCASVAAWLSLRMWLNVSDSSKCNYIDAIVYHVTCMLISVNDIVIGSYAAVITSVFHDGSKVMRKHNLRAMLTVCAINAVTIHRYLMHNELASSFGGSWWLVGPLNQDYAIVWVYRLLTLALVARYVRNMYMSCVHSGVDAEKPVALSTSQ